MSRVAGLAMFCIIAALILTVVTLLIISFKRGLQALDLARRLHGPYSTTMFFLAVNLCEPLINTVAVGLILTRIGFDRAIESPFLVTAPMAVLLLPALGITIRNPLYRSRSLRILWLGVGRWAVNVLIFTLVDTPAYVLLLLLIPLSIGLLWKVAHWGENEISDARAVLPPIASPPPAAALQAIHPRPATPAPAPISVRPALPDPATAIPCALCHTPTARTATECPSCGLVFLSRVPPALLALDRYVALRPLGSGGMSSVYLARDRVGGGLCVLKTLASVDAQADPHWRRDAAECLRREASLLGQINHLQIARLLDWIDDQQGYFLVLEYIAGPTLEQHLTRPGPLGQPLPGAALPPSAALAHGSGVGDTLCYLAGLPEPVVHCDIKPTNLILPPGRRTPVLVDFGGAVSQQTRANETTRLARYGTPGYAAPEQYQGQSSPKSDVYGLAATLYHLLTNDDPSAHPLAFPALAHLPSDIVEVLAPALERDPDARPDVRTFSTSLERLATAYAAD